MAPGFGATAASAAGTRQGRDRFVSGRTGALPGGDRASPAAASALSAAASTPSPGGSPAGPSAAPVAPARPLTIPILMYHVVDVPAPGAPYPELYVAPDLFAAQVAALAAAGYRAITLQQAYDIWQGAAAAPAHPVVFTFDDGYISQYTRALPVLAARGWPGVLNLEVSRVGVPGGLSVDQVRAMVAAGWEVDDHTLTHPDLTQVPPARLTAEVAGAAQRLRAEFGVPVRFFCYPAGRYDPAVIASVRAAGLLAATTTWPGDASPADGYYTLPRVRVSAGTSAAQLLATIRQYQVSPPPPPPPAFPGVAPVRRSSAPPHIAPRAAAPLPVAGSAPAPSASGASSSSSAEARR